MRKSSLVLMAGALLVTNLAFAAPASLSPTQMDQVVAGAVVEQFVNQAVPTLQTEFEDIALADGGSNTNTGNVALADNDSNAVAGDDNVVVDANLGTIALVVDLTSVDDSDVALGDGEILDVAVEVEDNDSSAVNVGFNNFAVAANEVDGSGAQVIGCGNTTYTAADVDSSAVTFGEANAAVDNSEVDGNIEEDSAGVIARTALVTDSFNIHDEEIEVEAEIEDSFNVVTNTLSVEGQNDATGIVMANALGQQNIVTNLVLTNSATNVPTVGELGAGQIPVAAALTAGVQLGVNDTFVLGIAADLSLPNGGVPVP